MKILAINGSPLKDRGNTDVILQEFLGGARSAGAEVEIIYLKDLKINPCLGKLSCWIKTPGICSQNDDMKMLLDKLAAAEVWVFASPVYWDGVTGPMKNVFERLHPMIEPHLTLKNGHCRHALREGIQTGKIILVSNCGFYEMDNFEPMISHLQAVAKNIHREFTGALVRPHGALVKYMVKNKNKTLAEVLAASRQAGDEFIKTGEISQEILSQVSQKLMSRDEYMEMVNSNFDRLLEKNIR